MQSFFEGKAIQSNGIHNVSSLQAFKFSQEGAIIVDVREVYLNRYKIFDVTALIFCPLQELPGLIAGLPTNKPLIIADASGIHSPEAVKMLLKHGFTGSCANLSGGLVEWEHAGLPVKINYDERVAGQSVTRVKE